MRKNLSILFALLVLMTSGMTISYAAFPVVTPNATTVAASNESNPVTEVVMRQANKSVQQHKDMPDRYGKSQIVAAILCAFLGSIGIHRFYLGYTWQGVVQLLTLGGCGIWSLIDFIRILTGDLGPKGGSYAKTF